MMFNTKLKEELANLRAINEQQGAILKALDRSTAMIEFAPDGTVITANENFLSTMGYRLNEVLGKHHRMFCDDSLANSSEYRDFWRRLNSGEYMGGQFKRKHKNGATVWLEASYNPVYDASGALKSIVKVASDVTPRVTEDLARSGLIQSINRSMAVIEFHPDGTIISANDNFLRAMGYKLADIQGQHHRKFCESAEASTSQYREFWAALNRGEFYSGQVKRLTQRGAVIWLEATYNPVYDENGKLCKIVKFAVDITDKVERQVRESEAAQLAYQIAQETDVSAFRQCRGGKHRDAY